MTECRGHLVENLKVHKRTHTPPWVTCGARKTTLQSDRWSLVTCKHCLCHQPLKSKQQLAAMKRRGETAR